MNDIYNVNQGIRFVGEFSKSGAPTDPTSVTLKVRCPFGVCSDYTDAELTKDSTGVYHKDMTLTAAGRWWWHWQGIGAVIATDEDYFEVKESHI